LSFYDGGHLSTTGWYTGNLYKLTIGSGGIAVRTNSLSTIGGRGTLTSSQSFLDIVHYGDTGNKAKLQIEAIIADNGSNKVGLRLSRTGRAGWEATILAGDQSNTFTGLTEVLGAGNILTLSKKNGAKAIQGDIFLDGGAQLALWNGNQIASRSTVRVRNSTFQFADYRYDDGPTKTESFHKLVVEGTSTLQFRAYETTLDKRFLYLDDLLVADGARLLVRGWKEGIHWFLIRKTSKSIDDALKKIEFEGYLPGRTHLEDYNSEYWAISGTPEPATCGAIFAIGALGLCTCRRRNRRKSGQIEGMR